jgi:ATP-binding cassette subfamily B protein
MELKKNMLRKNFPFYEQPDTMDCGATCIRIIAKYYGRSISLSKLRILSETTTEGASIRTLSNTAERIGFKTLGVKINFQRLEKEAPLPCIVYWKQQHFLIVYKIEVLRNKHLDV